MMIASNPDLNLAEEDFEAQPVALTAAYASIIDGKDREIERLTARIRVLEEGAWWRRIISNVRRWKLN